MIKLKELFDRIDVSIILNEHKTTFYHYETKKFYNKSHIPNSDKFLFVVFPVLLTIVLCGLGLQFNKDYLNIALTCLSIFAGLLFGLLTMVFNMIESNQKNKENNAKNYNNKKNTAKIDLTKHLFINIGFSIILTIFSLIAVLLTQFNPTRLTQLIHHWKNFETLKQIYLISTNGVAFFLIIEFFLTLLMVIRRFTMLFLNEVEEN
jgi:hypothetical protein